MNERIRLLAEQVSYDPEPAECHYTVGTDSVGNVVLKIGSNGYNSTTLTMHEVGTRRLIRMLEAAAPKYQTEEE